jgi:hypothetical protein
MNVAPIIHRSRFSLRALASDSGISYASLKHLSAANREATSEYRARIAKALRTHATRMLADADTLENGE